MRTTLTLDDDVAAMLERLRKAREQSRKELVNEALRQGLKQMFVIDGEPAVKFDVVQDNKVVFSPDGKYIVTVNDVANERTVETVGGSVNR